jgi:DNA-binding beta-propeller fold protein YncE
MNFNPLGMLLLLMVMLEMPMLVNANQAYVASGTTVNVIDVPSNTVVATIPGFAISTKYSIAITPSGKQTYVGTGTTVNVIDVPSNTVVATIPGFYNPVGIAITPNGKQAYVESGTTVNVIDVPSNTVVATIGGFTIPSSSSILVTPNGNEVFYGDNLNVMVIDVPSNTVVATIGGFGDPYGIAITPNGKQVYLPNLNGEVVKVIDVTTNSIVSTISGFSSPISIAITPSGKQAYVGSGFTVNVIDIPTNSIVATVTGVASIYSIAILPSGKEAYVGNSGTNIYAIDVPSNTVVATIGGFYGTSAIAITNPTYALNSATVPSTIGYETQPQSFTYSMTFGTTVSNAMVYLTYNNAIIGSSGAGAITSSPQSITVTGSVPLLPTNNVIATFNAYAVMTTQAGQINSGTFNTFKQTELWDYIPATIAQKSTILVGDSDNIFMNITQPVALNLAFVNVSTSQVGTSNSAYSSLFAYKYYRQLAGFTPAAYGYPGNTPLAIGVNSFLQLYFNGQNVWRNTSSPTAFTVVTANLTTCNPTYPTKSYYFTFWNASTGLQYTQNVQLNGNLRINNGAIIPGNTAGMPLTTNGFQYWTCQNPSYASFYVNATLNYSTSPAITLNANTVPSVTASYYLLNLPTSNVIKSIPLYLSYVTNPSTFNFEVQALNGSLISAIVEVSQYNVNNGNSVVVNDVKTPTGGGTTINLQTNAKYQFFVYSLNGQFLANTTVQTMYCLSGTVCNYVIPVGAGGITGLQQFTSNLNYGCTQTALAGNNERVQCTITSVNRTSIYGQLQVFKQGMVFNNMTCNQTASSMTVTLTCISSKTNNTSYHWILSANLGQYGITEIKFGDFGYSTGTSYGSVGWLFLIMLVMVSSLAFVKIPVLGMIGALLAVLVASFVGGIALTLGTIGCLILFFGLGIWVLGKGNT